VPAAPHRVRWTEHALDKARFLNVPYLEVERAVIGGHRTRLRNARAADWRVVRGRLVVAYNHPDHGDASTARVITLWRRR
jgi:hypothetical protein